MILFKIKKLEDKLTAGEVSDKEGMYYLTTNTLLYSLGYYIASKEDKSGWFFYLEVICVTAITLFGVFKSFDINKKGDGLDYFKRYQALVFVVTVRILALAILVMIVAAIILYQQPELLTSPLSMFVITVLTMVLFYYRLCESFKRISHANADLSAMENTKE